MNAIVKVTGLVVLVAAGCAAVGGGTVLAGPGPEVMEVGVAEVMEINPCVLVECPEPEEAAVPEIQVDPCAIGPCLGPMEINPCIFVDCEDDPGDEPSDEPGDEPEDDPGNDPADEPGDEPGDDPGDEPGDEAGDDPGDEPGDDPGDDPGDEPGDDPGDEPGDEPDLPNAGTGDGAATQSNQGVIGLAALSLAGVAIVFATVLTFRRKGTSVR